MKNIPNISFENKDQTKEFELLSLSELFANKFNNNLNHNPTQPHRINFFALLIITKGIGIHQIDLEKHNLKEGTVLKIAKGQVHNFQQNPQYEGFLILFTEDFVLNYFSQSTINLITHLYNFHLSSPITNNKELNHNFLKQLITEFDTKNTYGQKNIVAALLGLYLLRLERESQNLRPQHSNSDLQTFLAFKNLVETNYTTTRNVKDYAKMLFISTKQLNQIVKHNTLNTAKIFIDDYVILEAKRVMISTKKSLKEIAFEMGFEEVTNFTKFFKNKMGISPKTFQKNK